MTLQHTHRLHPYQQDAWDARRGVLQCEGLGRREPAQLTRCLLTGLNVFVADRLTDVPGLLLVWHHPLD